MMADLVEESSTSVVRNQAYGKFQLSRWPAIFSIVSIAAVMLDPLEETSTTTLLSVPALRRSSRQRAATSDDMLLSPCSQLEGGEEGGRGARRGQGQGGWRGDASPDDSPSDTLGSSSSSEDEPRAYGKKYPRPRSYWDTMLCAKWRKLEPDYTLHPFTGPQPGPSIPVANDATACDLFCRFFTDDVWALIVEETNRLVLSLNLDIWDDVTVDEMRAFIGLLLLMGVVTLPSLEAYWSSEPLLYTKVRDVMPKARFLANLRALHLNDSRLQVPIGQPDYDPLFKVRKLLDLVTLRFSTCMNMLALMRPSSPSKVGLHSNNA